MNVLVKKRVKCKKNFYTAGKNVKAGQEFEAKVGKFTANIQIDEWLKVKMNRQQFDVYFEELEE